MPVLKYWDQTAGAYVQLLVPGQATAYAQVQATAPNSSAPAIAPPNGFLWVDTSSSATISNLPYFPQQTPPASGMNSFTDGSGEVWVSRNGSAWKKARDVLHARIWRNAAYSYVANAWTLFPFDSTSFDAFGMVTLPNIIVPISGMYLVTAMNMGNLNSNVQFGQNICRNGANLVTSSNYPTFNPNYTNLNGVTNQLLTAGDTINVQMFCSVTNGSAPGQTQCFLTVDYMGTG